MNQLQQQFEAWSKSTARKPDSDLLSRLRGEIVLVKYGGNAMGTGTDRDQVLEQIALLTGAGIRPVVVHGGGPAIRELLDEVGLESEFVDGHRKTDLRAMRYVEMALRGRVNGEVVGRLNRLGLFAVGLSGKDASMVRAERRYHRMKQGDRILPVDLGYVGNVVQVDTTLIHMLLEHNYLPVLAPVATGSDGMDYNINADMFAGHLAGALGAAAFVAVTDVDGLMEDPSDPSTRIAGSTVSRIRESIGRSVRGGMIPKVEACLIALEQGVKKAHIVNGMKPETIIGDLLTNQKTGTTIVLQDE